jgi:signal transduction histidine kinase
MHLEDKVRDRTQELKAAFDNLKFTQKQLIEAEKMASLGSLVAGVSHEINTPIGISVTAASHLIDEVESFKSKYDKGLITKSSFESFLETSDEVSKIILSNMIKGSELIKSFKNIAVDQSSESKRKFDIEEYVHEILLSTRSKFKRTKHTIEFECQKEMLIDSYPGAISQVFTNLLMNTLNHGFESVEEGKITINITHNDDSVIILYHDTGCGIPEENLGKIFTPFFTTKRGAGGSGLGLSIVYNIITKTLSGEIECFSKPGDGTTFKMTIPGFSESIV